MNEPNGQITGPPYITLVDIDGDPVPKAEADIPHLPPDPDDCTKGWPAWTDICVVRLLARSPYEHAIGATRMAEAWRAVMIKADEETDEPDEATLISRESPDGPDVARRMIDRGMLPPVSGGSSEAFEPDEADWECYRCWAETLDRHRDAEDMRRWYAENPLGAFNELRDDDSETLA